MDSAKLVSLLGIMLLLPLTYGVVPPTDTIEGGGHDLFPLESTFDAASLQAAGPTPLGAGGMEVTGAGLNLPAVAVAAGHEHTCVIVITDDVVCWGEENHGKAEDYLGAEVRQIAAGWSHNCVVLAGGTVDCWGQNDKGQADGYSGGNAIKVAVGREHSCALLTSGNVACWGEGRLGATRGYSGGDAIDVASGALHSCVLIEGGNVRCWGHSGYGQTAPYDGGDGLLIALGSLYTCVLTEDHNVDCWGDNDHGEADPYNGGDAADVEAGAGQTCIVKINERGQCWGRNDYGQAPHTGPAGAQQVAVGSHHSCFLLSSGSVKCYGLNQDGQAADYVAVDLPRITLGQDESLFSASLYAMGEGSMSSTLSFCEDDLIRLIEHLEKYDPGIVGPLNPTPGLPDGLSEAYVDLKGFLNDEVGLDWCIDGSVSLDNSQQEAYQGGFVQAFTTGLGADIPLPIPAGKAKTFFQGLQMLNAIGSFGNWATAGHEFLFQRGCEEQQHQLSGRMIIDYDFKGRVITGSAGAEVTAAWLRVDAGVASPLGQTLSPAWEANLEELSTWGALAWVSEREVDIQSKQVEIPFYATEGPKNTYVRLTSGASNLGLLGVSYHNADAGSDDRGFDIHRIKYEFDDESPPQVTTRTDGPVGREGWFLGPVEISATARDPQSCINLVRLRMDGNTLDEVGDSWNPVVNSILVDEGTNQVTSWARNMKSIETAEDQSVFIDATPPGSSHSISGTAQNGWYNSCVTLTINSVDSTSGSAEQFSDRPGEGELMGEVRDFCADGIEPFTYWAWDVAGNVEGAKDGPVLKIDRTPPDGGVGPYDGQEGYEDWYQSCVLVPVLGWDGLSGFDYAEHAINDGEFTEGDEAEVCDQGFNEVHVIAHDVAGNEDIQRSFEVKVDDTDPTVGTSVSLVTLIGNPAQVSYEADDALSGLYGTIGVEMRYEPLLGTPTDYEPVCTDESYEASHSGSCEVPLDETGRYCFRTSVGDRALNVGVSDSACTTYAAL